VFKRVHSDLQTGINKILKFMMILVVPLTILLIWSQIRTVGGFAAAFATDEWRTAVAHAVAGIVGMIPDGLILLTSMNFALAAMKLARKNTLISQLESVETLARVDSLNLDKTGTLTDGGIALSDFIAFRGIQQRHLKQVLFDVVNEESPNPTAQAILRAFAEEGISSAGVSERINFSSSRKWSAAKLSDGSVWCAGAPEILLAASEVAYPQVAEQVENAARHGYRVLLLVQVGDVAGDVAEESDIFAQLKDGHIPSNLTPAAIVLCMESVRADAKQTLEYFREQGVRIRVISGDNPQTVGTIARKVEMLGPDHEIRVMDARELPSDVDQLAEVLEDVDVLGRVLPEQKKQIVQALHRKGKVVAMTGDGVNDALAIKEADLGIAMGNAAPATKSVAEVILTDSKFSHLPDVVAEGRQVMGNMERVSGLFLTKTVYAAILAIGTVVAQIAYPWLPIHISFIGALTIGFPAFILALAPNKQLYRPGFLRRVVDFALPSGIVIGCYMIAISLGLPAIFGWDVENSDAQLSLLYSFSYIPLFVLAVCVLTQVCRPLLGWRGGLVVLIAGMGVAGAFIPLTARFFEIHIPTGQYLLPLFAVILVGVALWFIVVTIVQRIAKRLAAHHLIDEK
jgi:cation-transporting ATPase E